MYRPTEFYQDPERKKKWSNRLKKTNASGAIEFSKRRKALRSLVSCKYTKTRLLEDLRKKPLHVVLIDVKKIGIVFPKKAIRILLQSVPKNMIDEINKERKRTKISEATRKQFENLEFKRQVVERLSKIKKHRSKGEQRLRSWLIENFPEFDWGSRHLFYENDIYEYDIFSRKFDDFYIEYNGIIHYKPIYSKQKYDKIQNRDRKKEQIAKKLGKKFIVIKDSWDFNTQKKVIEKFLNN